MLGRQDISFASLQSLTYSHLLLKATSHELLEEPVKTVLALKLT